MDLLFNIVRFKENQIEYFLFSLFKMVPSFCGIEYTNFIPNPLGGITSYKSTTRFNFWLVPLDFGIPMKYTIFLLGFVFYVESKVVCI